MKINKEIDFPQDDVECWDRYPKHRWVYDLSRLLDTQNIKWSPFETSSLNDRVSTYIQLSLLIVNLVLFISTNPLSNI